MKHAQRIQDIVKSNINAVLDEVENPDKMIRSLIQEMEDSLIKLKTSCADKIAEKTYITEELEKAEAAAKRWTERAELAIKKGKDDFAREALIEKHRAERRINDLSAQLTSFDSIIQECRSNSVELESRLQQVKQKQRVLIQRGIHAKETIIAREQIKAATNNDAFRRFAEIEHRIEQLEAEAEMAGFASESINSNLNFTTETEFSTMEQDSEADEELSKLKKALKQQNKQKQQA